MTVTEEVKRMHQQGVGEEQIIQVLRERGVDYREISDALAQSRIKAAVEQPDLDPSTFYPGGHDPESQSNMEPSIMSSPSPEPEVPAPTPGSNNYAPESSGYRVQQPQEYTTPAYTEGYSQTYTGTSDLTTEIAEQVVAEKLTEIRKHLEKIADMKTTVESRLEYLDERLKRIEKTIDVLQSSVLRKVGDYVTNVDDIKKELIETQKTFAKLLPEARKVGHETHHPHHKR